MRVTLDIGIPGRVERDARVEIAPDELSAVWLSIAQPELRNRTRRYMRRHPLEGELLDPNHPVRERDEPDKLSIAEHLLRLRQTGRLPQAKPVREEQGEWYGCDSVMLGVPISDLAANLLRPSFHRDRFGSNRVFAFADEPLAGRNYWCLCCYNDKAGAARLEFAHLRFNLLRDTVEDAAGRDLGSTNLMWAACVVPLVVNGDPLSAVQIARQNYDLRQMLGRDAVPELRYAYQGWPADWEARVAEVVERHTSSGQSYATFYHSVIATDPLGGIHLRQVEATLPDLARGLAEQGFVSAGLLDSGGSCALYDVWLGSYLNRGWYFREARGAILVFQLRSKARLALPGNGAFLPRL